MVVAVGMKVGELLREQTRESGETDKTIWGEVIMVEEYETAGKKEILREILSHLGATIGYLLFVSFFLIGFSLPFWVGGLLGANLLDLDHVLYVFTHLEEESGRRFIQLCRRGRPKEGILYIAGVHKESERMILHNSMFAAILACGTALWIWKSGSNLFQVGLMLSILLHLLKDMVSDLKDTEHLRRWLFWYIRKPVNKGVLAIYVGWLSLMFFLSTFLLSR